MGMKKRKSDEGLYTIGLESNWEVMVEPATMITPRYHTRAWGAKSPTQIEQISVQVESQLAVV